MELQKFGVKLFLDASSSYSSKHFIPIFHSWIQHNLISDHLLIDVADYSHMIDGPGIILIAHEGHFSLDQENYQPGMMYMRKTKLEGTFIDRFNQVLSIVIDAANRIQKNDTNQNIQFIKNSFRFISNDRLYAENNINNQNLLKKEIQRALKIKFPNSKVDYKDFSSMGERLAFSIKLPNEVNILE